MLFAVIADAASWLVRAIDDYPFDFYRQIDAYLPLVFLFGFALLLPSISIALQTKRAANLAQFPLTTTGPLIPELRREAGQVESGESASRRSSGDAGKIPPPMLAFVPSPSHRKLLQRLGWAILLLAGLLYASGQSWIETWVSAHPNIVFAYAHSYNQLYDVTDLLFYILVAVGITLLLWPELRETEELSLQGEVRSTYMGMPRVDRTHRRLIPVMKPLSSLRVLSYVWLMVLFIVWIIFSIITPRTPRGLKVYVPKPGTYALATDKPRKEPLVLRIDAQGNLYLNLQPVPRADFEKRLRMTLSRLADRTVFLDADPSLTTGEVIWAIDVIRSTWDTKVILVTPSMKKEKPVLAVRPPCESKAPKAPELRLPLKWRDHRFYEYPRVSFVVGESGKLSNVKIQREGDIPEFTEWLARSARKLKYPPAPGCGEHELYVGYSW